MADQTDGRATVSLVQALVRLDPSAQDKQEALRALQSLLASQPDGQTAKQVITVTLQITMSAEDKRQTREALLRLLAGQTDKREAENLVDGLIQLDPTVRDLSGWRAWAIRPAFALLGAARRNSPLEEWMTYLSTLTADSG